MDDTRLPFPDAKRAFAEFLRAQGWPTEVLWLTRDRVTGRRQTYWVFRPEELTADAATRACYEAARRTATSLRMDAFGQLDGRTLAYVQDYGGESRMLNFGVPSGGPLVQRVGSVITWRILRAFTKLAGESPSLATSRITDLAVHRH